MAGFIHVIGFVAGSGDINQLPAALIGTAATVRGILIGSVRQFNDMNRLISVNKLRPVVDRVFDFEQLREAYEYLDSQKHVGKVVIKVARN
jgi:D-arabinose 1-dehydrogenase-like Zn-dependent alcohol dehydrogenase